MKTSLGLPYKQIEKQIATVVIRNYAANSYLYYRCDWSAITDGEYDALCKWILQNYDWIKPHDISGYLSKESLECGSGFDIADKVCGQTKDYADMLYKLANKRNPKVTKARRKNPETDEIDLADLL